MKKIDYLSSLLFLILAIAGIFIKGYFGGLLTGIFITLLLFVSVGKILYNKALKRTEAAFQLRKRMEDFKD